MAGQQGNFKRENKSGENEQPSIIYGYYGAVAERLKATVLKTVVPTGTGGSNPSCSDWPLANRAVEHLNSGADENAKLRSIAQISSIDYQGQANG